MHIFRYRSPGLLSQKELIYDEWYFASQIELNDPIDMQSAFIFPADSEGDWKRLASRIWKGKAVEAVASYFSELCPVSYDGLVGQYDIHITQIFKNLCQIETMNTSVFQDFKDACFKFRGMLAIHAPGSGYSVSFSKTDNDLLMWSHYSASHAGYCLIFRPMDGCLNQCRKRKKDRVKLAEGHYASVPDGFKLESIEYSDEVAPINAFYRFPQIYTELTFDSEEERLAYHDGVKRQLLTKNRCWDYEKEVRLLLPQSAKWVSGENDLTSYQRIFHYDFGQVVGVIFGARMKEHDKKVIREIVRDKLYERDRLVGSSPDKEYVFNFLFRQAEICTSQRLVRLIDKEMFSMGRWIEPGSQGYEEEISNWREGRGVTIEAGHMSRDCIPAY